ncbi:MAG TPA: polysaccharide deacetylase family protein [Trebonia sp.]|nr:polysaccharide deacetylase family protein [Trebonia sp.]
MTSDPPASAAADGYPRDLGGYGANPPHPRWPGGARIAVSVVVNWEEGGETNVLHGDPTSEAACNDVVDAVPRPGVRDLRTESMFEYGSRAGVWRLRRLLAERGVPATVFAVGMAVERSPQVVAALAADGHEICPHGYRWLDYAGLDAATERAHIARTVEAIRQVTGERPVGWYTGRMSGNTRRCSWRRAASSTIPTTTATTCRSGPGWQAARTWSSPTPST